MSLPDRKGRSRTIDHGTFCLGGKTGKSRVVITLLIFSLINGWRIQQDGHQTVRSKIIYGHYICQMDRSIQFIFDKWFQVGKLVDSFFNKIIKNFLK